MTTQNKAIIKSGIIAGAIYAGLMTAFDYFIGQREFLIWRFLFSFFFFGIFIGLITRYNFKKQKKKENDK